MGDTNNHGQRTAHTVATGSSTGTNFFDNMESLATAAHAQTQQSSVSYNLPHPVPQNIVDPMFYLNDPQHQSQLQSSQQFYTTPTYTSSESHFSSQEQLRHVLHHQLEGGGSAGFQQFMGQLQYQGPLGHQQQQQQLLALQRGQQMVREAAEQQTQQNLQLRTPTKQERRTLSLQTSENANGQDQSQIYDQQSIVQKSLAGSSQSPVTLSPRKDMTESAKTRAVTRTVPDRTLTKSRSDFRPKTAIPQDLLAEEYAAQCIQAAVSSRLSPYALHRGEYEMLRQHINYVQITTYLHIRNGILRLWHRNPLVSVTREEAAGCAKDYRFFDVSEVAYDWLVRNGYINFGCIEVPDTAWSPAVPTGQRKTVVVIGAGMAGLGCARQLEGLFCQFGAQLPPNELLPQVIILEARGRIGGRVYSHPLKHQSGSTLPPGKRATADMGAQVITGFDNGNPLGVLIRGQLALDYHSLRDNSVLYDTDGSIVDKDRDGLVERLFNDILDRVSAFKQKPILPKTLEGDRALIESGKDPASEGGRMISVVEENEVVLPPIEADNLATNIPGTGPFTASVDKFTGKPSTATGSSASIPAAEQVKALGWELKPELIEKETITLEAQGNDPQYPTLGKTMDYVLDKYRDLLDLNPLDLRLINWHYANLEYANASNVDSLSLGHWDQDDGHEPSGPHAMLLGGYTQVCRGLLLAPTRLDVKTRHAVKRITYGNDANAEFAWIECENGQVIEADKVVVTLPLGVLKANTVEFNPPLPDWKKGAIDRLGYGLLNKVVLVYDRAFWDIESDMVGLLREPTGDPNDHASYEANRGRFYMFWNCVKTSGKPLLVALMAGDAAAQTECQSDEELIYEATLALQNMYPADIVPPPRESIITRWGKDPYSRGSYSYVGQEATAEDYDLMAKPIGNQLYFAGEASCKSHPATVHGAYISGLRAAAEIADDFLGPIKVPSPLIPPKPKLETTYSASGSHKRKAEISSIEKARELKTQRLQQYEQDIHAAIVEAIGERPSKPGRSGANPFLLYQKDHWFICKDKCDEARRKSTNNPGARATRNEVRAALGQMWRDAPDEQRRPYLNETEKNKENNAAVVTEFKKQVKDWDVASMKFRKEYIEKHPSFPTEEELQAIRQADLEKQEIKRSRKLNGYAPDSGDEL